MWQLTIHCVNNDTIYYIHLEHQKQTVLNFLKMNDHEGSSISLYNWDTEPYINEEVYEFLTGVKV